MTGLALALAGLVAIPGAGRAAPPGDEVGPRVAPEPRIVGGRAIGISRAPWQVAIVHSPERKGGNAFERQFCGGSLLTPTLVITAAHCLIDVEGSELAEVPARDLAVVAGRAVLSDAGAGEELAVREVIHFRDEDGRPLYFGEGNPWDMVALQLAAPSTSGEPIRIPGPDEDELWSAGRRSRVSGWGSTRPSGSFRARSDRLLAAQQIVLEDRRCADVFHGQFDLATSICAAALSGGRGSCNGDSGGPVVVPTAQGDARLVGDVQGGGRRCAEKRGPFYYGKFGAPIVRAALDDVAVRFGGAAPGAIVGSGGTPPLDVQRRQGRELTWAHAQDACDRARGCRKSSAGRCKRAGNGVECRARTLFGSRRGGRVCAERMLWTADTGAIEGERRGGRRCRRR